MPRLILNDHDGVLFGVWDGCPHAVLDYQYATWWSCRTCGVLVERVPVSTARRGTSSPVNPPMSLQVWPARAHARKPHKSELDDD